MFRPECEFFGKKCGDSNVAVENTWVWSHHIVQRKLLASRSDKTYYRATSVSPISFVLAVAIFAADF